MCEQGRLVGGHMCPRQWQSDEFHFIVQSAHLTLWTEVMQKLTWPTSFESPEALSYSSQAFSGAEGVAPSLKRAFEGAQIIHLSSYPNL